MDVSVIIVTIGTKNYLKSCLDSLFAQSQPPFEVIVIDNSTEPQFARKINGLYPSVKVFSGAENLFYAAGMNKGIELSRGEFILCLNDDIVLEKNFIRAALKGFLTNKNIGMVSGKILRPDKKTLDSTGLILSACRKAEERGYGEKDLGQFERNGFVFGSSGAAAFYRRRMLEAIKERGDYFDSRFRMFYEDLDLSWRANKKGWRGYYISNAVAYHVRGGSFRPDSGLDEPIARKYLSDELHRDLIKNRYLTILKNETIFGLVLHIIPVLMYDLCAWAYVLLFRPKVLMGFFKKRLTAGRDLQDSK